MTNNRGTVPLTPLAKARTARGWYQKDVAEQLGTNETTVSRWERGICLPSPYFGYKLAELFGTSREELGLLPPEPVTLRKHLFDPAIPFSLFTRGLIGREETMADLPAHLSMPGGVVAHSGLPGAGKTALAVALGDTMRPRVNGMLWFALGPQPDVGAHLRRIARLLGVADGQNEQDLPHAIRQAIGHQRMLIVLDDVWSVQDALACMVGGPCCSYILTSRSPAIALRTGDWHLVVPELSEDEGLRVLSARAPSVASTYEAAVRELVRAVGGLPLALILIGNYLRLQASFGQPRRVVHALEHLRDPVFRLQLTEPQSAIERPPALREGLQLSLQAVVEASDSRLHEHARLALRALSALPCKPASFSEEAALAVADCSPGTLDMLVDAGLLESLQEGRYSLHPVIAQYAAAHALERQSAVAERLLQYVQGLQVGNKEETPEGETIKMAARLADQYGLPFAPPAHWGTGNEKSTVLPFPSERLHRKRNTSWEACSRG